MVQWPKFIVGNEVTIAVTLIVGLALVQSAIALSGSFVWISLSVVALVVFVAVVAYRRAQAASDLAPGRRPFVRGRASPVEPPQGSRGGEAGTPVRSSSHPRDS
jgi:uncharacterized membrane protein